jgi:SAM-dependent methyltransferase
MMNLQYSPALFKRSRPCPICLSLSATTAHVVNGFDLGRCGCGMVFADVTEADTDGGNVYEEDYFYYYMQCEPLTTSAFYDLMAKRMKGRVLDFGCGIGEFVARARAQGIDAHGVDRAPYARLASEKLGIPIYATLDEAPDASFDVVLSHAAFEHLHDPAGIAKALLGKLKRGGTFMISGVPNYNSVERRLGSFESNYPPGHVNYFSPQSLRRFCVDLGLQRVSVRTYGLPVWYVVHALRRKNGGSGVQAFNYVPGYVPEKREPGLLHRLFARVYYSARVPGMGVSLIATGVKT